MRRLGRRHRGGGCARYGTGSVSYGYGVHYGSGWGYDPFCYGGGPVYVGPPPTSKPPGARPPSGGSRPPQASLLPARPMPAPRLAGGGRRR